MVVPSLKYSPPLKFEKIETEKTKNNEQKKACFLAFVFVYPGSNVEIFP